ncbi:TetR/AcrR family transcriptional regulator [Enterococcus sp. DIV0756]|uniref:TetR/AcrR family transcriptional regulator n=1 Tax=Enterococcus sp. DIV0756 TaxID=2774636 RepID=UPI003F1F5CE4
MLDKKTAIYESAKELFFQEGYKNVSLRDIAEAAGTTIGNLTYHFPKKEDLLLRIQKELYEEFFAVFDSEITQENAMSVLLKSFYEIQEIREKNRFYYEYIINIHEEFPSMKEELLLFRKRLKNFYQTIFQVLVEDGVMREDLSASAYKHLVTTISYLTYTWYQVTTPYYDDTDNLSLSETLTSLVQPYLTKKGQKSLEFS